MLDGQAQPVPLVLITVLFDAAKKHFSDDVDRMATSYIKYFLPLMEPISGEAFERVSGVDLPPLLHIEPLLMKSHEWRQCTPLSLAALLERLALRIFRLLFADILIRLWGLSPEKLSLRRVAVSLVFRERKARAMIFLFPPGVADIPKTSPWTMWPLLEKAPRSPLLLSSSASLRSWIQQFTVRVSNGRWLYSKSCDGLHEVLMPPGLPLPVNVMCPADAHAVERLPFVLNTTDRRRSSICGDLTATMMKAATREGVEIQLLLTLCDFLRGSSENRCSMLFEDFLTAESSYLDWARHTFGLTFARKMSSATRNV
ncbi:hypothetical protein CEK25_000715 [Fusarium fujikuroi]|nr:hypothetical protein CEK25_000715 [Fusarium fujikuroi]